MNEKTAPYKVTIHEPRVFARANGADLICYQCSPGERGMVLDATGLAEIGASWVASMISMGLPESRHVCQECRCPLWDTELTEHAPPRDTWEATPEALLQWWPYPKPLEVDVRRLSRN